MTTILLLRGPAAVGKTTTAKLLAKELPDAAHIQEDYFRGLLQVKRGDPLAHEVSGSRTCEIATILIQGVIDNLLSLDSYRYIIVDGLFPDANMLGAYEDFCRERHHGLLIFEFRAPKEVLLARNTIARGHTVREAAIDDHLALLLNPYANSILIENTESVEKTLGTIMKTLTDMKL